MQTHKSKVRRNTQVLFNLRIIKQNSGNGMCLAGRIQIAMVNYLIGRYDLMKFFETEINKFEGNMESFF